MSEKLLKRLNHNIKRISEPTVKQLLIDCASFVETALQSERRASGEEGTVTARVPDEDATVLVEMKEMIVLMERAGFIGILETYKSAKHKLPNCVVATRVDGKITEFVVHFGGDDETAVILRNPECVEAEQVVPISVCAPATDKEEKPE